MPMAWFAVLPITSAVRFLAFPIPLVKGLKVPVSTGSCVLGRMRASVGSWLSSVLLVSLGRVVEAENIFFGCRGGNRPCASPERTALLHLRRWQ